MDDALLDVFCVEDLRQLDDRPVANRGGRRKDEASLARVTRGLDRRVEVIVRGVTADRARDLTAALDVEQSALKVNLAGQFIQPVPLLHAPLGEVYRASVAHLRETLMTSLSRDEAVEHDRGLIDRIVLHPVSDVLCEFAVDIDKDLAGILSLTRNNRKAVTLPDDDLLQITLVAGTGFEPVTFRL